MMRSLTRRDLLLLGAACAVLYALGLTNHGLTNWQEAQRAVVAREMQANWHAERGSDASGGWRAGNGEIDSVVTPNVKKEIAGEGWRALIVPTNCGTPYLAKPPLMYWAQIAIAEARGWARVGNGRTGEFELRAVVAIAGTLGVLATYWCVLTLVGGGRRTDGARANGSYAAGESSRENASSRVSASSLENVSSSASGSLWAGASSWAGVPATVVRGREEAWARAVAIWAALCLATGVLYVRSSRIGELDILLVPSVVLAITGVARSWRRHLERSQADVPGIVLAAVAATFAVMTKGPAGLAVIALASYGGIALWTALTREPLETFWVPRFTVPWRTVNRGGGEVQEAGQTRWRVIPSFETPRVVVAGNTPSVLVWLVALTAACVIGIVSLWHAASFGDVLGSLGHALAAGAIAAILARLAHPTRLKAYWAALTRTHPVGVLGIPLLVFFAWWRAVEGIVGREQAAAAAMGEADDNLHWFTPDAIVVNLEALAYGVGLGSIACLVCLVWLLKDRPRVRPGWVIAIAWLVLGAWIFAASTKGVVRYLTPVWPSVAALAGVWIATRIGESRRPGMVRAVFGSIIAVLLIVQTWWYGFGREASFAERSPRALVAEVMQRFNPDPTRMATFELRTPAIDFYVGQTVTPIGEIGMRESMAGVAPISLDELAARIRAEKAPMTVFLRLSGPDALGRRDLKPAVERLVEAGFTVSVLNTEHHFVTDSGRSVVGVAIVDVTR